MKYMKPCSSFSPSSDYDDDGNLLPYNSRSRRNEGCIGGILRRILCIKCVPSCLFDHHHTRRCEEDEKGLPIVGSSASTPGIVARLMGLESVPLIQSIVRSPSRNSFRKSISPNGKYLRIIPTYQELEDENFFILNFEQQGDQEIMDSISIDIRKSHLNYDKKKHNMGAKCKKSKAGRASLQEWNKENQGINTNIIVSEKVLGSGMDHNSDLKSKNSSNVLSPLKNSAEKQRKKKVKQDSLQNKLEIEGRHDSENSSPNSVLDFVEYDKAYTDTANSGDISRLANSKLRRTLSEELKNYENFKEKKMLINNGCGEEQQTTSLRNRNNKTNFTYKWDEIRKLAEREMIKSSWVHDEVSKTQHYFKEIGRDVASEILDQLLVELLINFP